MEFLLFDREDEISFAFATHKRLVGKFTFTGLFDRDIFAGGALL